MINLLVRVPRCVYGAYMKWFVFFILTWGAFAHQAAVVDTPQRYRCMMKNYYRRATEVD